MLPYPPLLCLLDLDDLHHVGGSFSSRIAGRQNDQLSRQNAVILGECAGQLIIVGHVILDIGEDRRHAPVAFQLSLRGLGEGDRKNRYTRTEFGDSAGSRTALREGDDRTDIVEGQRRIGHGDADGILDGIAAGTLGIIQTLTVRDDLLRCHGDGAHHLAGFDRILAGSRLR